MHFLDCLWLGYNLLGLHDLTLQIWLDDLLDRFWALISLLLFGYLLRITAISRVRILPLDRQYDLFIGGDITWRSNDLLR